MSPVGAEMDRRRPRRYRDCRNSPAINSLNWHLKVRSIIGPSDVNCLACPACRSLISAILLLIKHAVRLGRRRDVRVTQRSTQFADLVSETLIIKALKSLNQSSLI